MGGYSRPLAPRFADSGSVASGQRALDVGCGPGALTTELVGRLGPDAVCADKSVGAERLPFADRFLIDAGAAHVEAECQPFRVSP